MADGNVLVKSQEKGKGKMSFKLEPMVLPKSNKGRKAQPLDGELIDALEDFLKNSPPVDQGDFYSPQANGPSNSYEKDHQAQAQGRKYAVELAKRLSKKVSVTVVSAQVEMTVKGKKETQERYRWKVYIPLSEFPNLKETGEGIEEAA